MALPIEVDAAVGEYLDRADEALPGAIEGFYVVGSTAMGAFRPGRSDVDFVAVVGRELSATELARLRSSQRRLYAADVARAFGRPPWRWQWPLTCNGVYVQWSDLARPTEEVVPVAGHVSAHFEVAHGFDVNPVTWRTLRTRGIAVRGPEPSGLPIYDDDAGLRMWTRDNLNTYWRRWADSVRRPGLHAVKANIRHMALAWAALGAPRLHCTIATGDVISKEAGGEYALEVFDHCWRPLVRDALDYWRGTGTSFAWAPRRRRESADFVETVIESASHLP